MTGLCPHWKECKIYDECSVTCNETQGCYAEGKLAGCYGRFNVLNAPKKVHFLGSLLRANITVGLLFFAIFVLAALPFSSAELGTFKQFDAVSIRVLANCSQPITLVEVTSPNRTFTINAAMTNLGGQTYNYTFYNTSSLGSYSYSWNNPCIDCSQGNCGNSFEVTVTGQTLTTGKSVTYILIFVISFIMLIGLLILGFGIPSNNEKDKMTGYILAVSNLKYLKMLFIGFAYVVALFISYFSWMVCYAYLDMNFLSTIFQFIFYALAICTLPLFIVGSYLTVANLIRDSQIADALTRGLRIK